MRCKVNGETLDLPEGLTVAALLERMEIPPVRVAVEVDREIVPKSDYDSHRLAEGAQVEIVSFVGGG